MTLPSAQPLLTDANVEWPKAVRKFSALSWIDDSEEVNLRPSGRLRERRLHKSLVNANAEFRRARAVFGNAPAEDPDLETLRKKRIEDTKRLAKDYSLTDHYEGLSEALYNAAIAYRQYRMRYWESRLGWGEKETAWKLHNLLKSVQQELDKPELRNRLRHAAAHDPYPELLPSDGIDRRTIDKFGTELGKMLQLTVLCTKSDEGRKPSRGNHEPLRAAMGPLWQLWGAATGKRATAPTERGVETSEFACFLADALSLIDKRVEPNLVARILKKLGKPKIPKSVG